MKISSKIVNHKGFTLVELLVTITIIIILSSVSFVAVSSMRNKSKGVECANNLKSLWTAGQSFANDWNGRLPANDMPDYPDTTADERIGWMAAIAPYVNGDDDIKAPRLDKTFRCPMDPLLKGADVYLTASPESVSYVPWTDGSDEPSNPQSPINISRGYDQVNVPWLSDGLPIPSTMNVISEGEYMEYVDPAKERHDEKVNVLYVGGAVKMVDNPSFDRIAPYGVTREHILRGRGR